TEPEGRVVAVDDLGDLLEELGPSARVQEVLPRLARDVRTEEVAGLAEGGMFGAPVDHGRPGRLGPPPHFDGVEAVVTREDERSGDELDLVAVVARVVSG